MKENDKKKKSKDISSGFHKKRLNLNSNPQQTF